MPTYAYTCTGCGHAFDVHQSFSDDALTVCPECDGRLRKVFSSVGVTFKGSGFYRTDSRGSAKKPASTTRATAGSTTSESSGTPSGSSTGSSTAKSAAAS